MDSRVSRWKVGEVLGKPRAAWFQSWLDWGLIPPPDEDGTWDEGVLARAEHARALGASARPLARRVILLHRDGFRVETAVRRRAVAYVLAHLTRPSHKMAQVQWELRAMGTGFRPPRSGQRLLLHLELPPSRWAEVPTVASDGLFDQWYPWAALVTPQLALVGVAKDVPLRDPIPYEERLSLALVTQLLSEDHVRNRVRLPRMPPRYALSLEG